MIRTFLTAVLSLSVLLSTISGSFAYDLDDKLDVDYMKAKANNCPEIKIKDPGLAAALGFLPGGGSFYTGQFGLGVLDVILWPFSILWDAPGSANRSIKKNKLATVEMCKDKDKEK